MGEITSDLYHIYFSKRLRYTITAAPVDKQRKLFPSVYSNAGERGIFQRMNAPGLASM